MADVLRLGNMNILLETFFKYNSLDRNLLGEVVLLSDARYRVIGVIQKKGTNLGMDLDDVVFIPETSGQELFDTDGLFDILAAFDPLKSPQHFRLRLNMPTHSITLMWRTGY